MLRTLLFSVFLVAACTAGSHSGPAQSETAENPVYDAQHHQADRALATLRTLSSDRFAGRRTGTPGNARAIAWIEDRLTSMKVVPYGDNSYRHSFATHKFNAPDETVKGTNLLAMIEGKGGADSPLIVLSAHFDHLGKVNGDIYNGADDNASGVAALLETISWFQANPPDATLIFAFFDAEETGFGGSSHFVRTLSTTDRSRLAFNLNLDMVARADDGVLYAVGAYHNPRLVPLIDRTARSAPITLKRGHDSPEWGDEDWSLMSDHAPFLRAGIPIIYLGVENHADYHQPTDTFDRVDQATFARSVDTVILMAEAVDKWVAAKK
ncbi:M20/M25/M40 family metallo-hydrolase [Henriciella sp.]|uniref:M20/M25/M40 family metallo-hydrolase n=1 Tax=Henriciella sp. TaxID=1968823 RepID=UPI002627F908|nr:M20/M25/M40 family metallo-hydrolase [Henriciella sp.]